MIVIVGWALLLTASLTEWVCTKLSAVLSGLMRPSHRNTLHKYRCNLRFVGAEDATSNHGHPKSNESGSSHSTKDTGSGWSPSSKNSGVSLQKEKSRHGFPKKDATQKKLCTTSFMKEKV